LRYYKRRWDESRGDEHDEWGLSIWYFEVGDDGFPARQLQVYDGGPALKYDEAHLDDEFGGLGDQAIDLEEFAPFEIDGPAFETAWSSAVARNRHAAG
jgi:hypothetical protein